MRDPYLEQAAERSAISRAQRLQRLRARRLEIERSTQMFVKLIGSPDDRFTEKGRGYRSSLLDDFLLPHEYVMSPERVDPSAPAVAALVARQGEAIRMLLVATALDQLANRDHTKKSSPASVRVVPNGNSPSWPILLGFPAELSERASSTRVHRMMTALCDVGVASLPAIGTRNRYRSFELVKRGRGRASDVHIPAELFTRGWLTVLTPSEIAVYLALRRMRDRHKRKKHEEVFLPRDERLSNFGLSDEVYLSHRELAEFSIVRTIDPVKGRRRGRVKPAPGVTLLPFEFWLLNGMFETNGYRVVTSALSRNTVAPRLQRSDWDTVVKRGPSRERREALVARAVEDNSFIDTFRASDTGTQSANSEGDEFDAYLAALLRDGPGD